MSTLASILVATVIIAGLIAMRIVIFESAFRQRLKSGRTGSGCEARPCASTCSPDGAAAVAAGNQNESRRSTPHAS